MRFPVFAATLLVVAGVASSLDASAGGRPDLVRQDLARGVSHVPEELLVQFHAGFDEAAQGRALARVQGRRAELVLGGRQRSDSKGDLVRVRLPRGLAPERAIELLGLESIVEFAEPNWIYQHHASNDTFFGDGRLWGMYGDVGATATVRNAFGSQAAEAWAAGTTDCSSVYVGIIDEGYMFAHTDIGANAAVNPGEVAGDGRDNDGNGLVDDVRGWDFAGNNNTVFDGAGDDHGTHVAGTIGAIGNNGTGVAGVCWQVKLLNAKFLGSTGGTLANAIKAIDYFTTLKLRQGLNIVATNNSWGGGGYSQGLLDAINSGGDQGILFIAAAGNSTSNNDTTASYPSNYACTRGRDWDCVIAVASITSTGALSSFSSFGATTVDVGAPGSGINSTVPASSKGRVIATYANYSGTSMATPHVTGAAALYKAKYPAATAKQIRQAIIQSATATSSLSGRVATGGRLNVPAMLAVVPQ